MGLYSIHRKNLGTLLVTEPINIIAVEDSVVNAKMIQRALEDERFQIAIYPTTEEGVAAIIENTPDIILMDVTLPGMNGYEACKKVREQEGLQLVPLVFLSARSSTEEKIKGYQAGGDDYLTKPFEPQELAAKILKHVETAKGRRHLAQKVEQAVSYARKSKSKSINLVTTLKFVENIGLCYTLDDMVTCLFDTLIKWGLRSTIQIRLPEKWITLFDDERHRELEIDAIRHSFYQGRIIEFGPRCFVNYNDVSLLIKNMPPRCGRYEPLHEYLFAMVEALHNRMITQAQEQRTLYHWRQLMSLLGQTHCVLDESHQTLSQLIKENHGIFDNILSKIEDSLPEMHLTEAQEEALMTIVRQGENATEHLFRRVLREDERNCQVVSDLEHIKMINK